MTSEIIKFRYSAVIFFALLWLYTCFGFFVELLPPLGALTSLVLLLCDFGLFIISLITIRRKSLKYLFLFIGTVLCGLASYPFNSGISASQFINGIRDFIPLFFSFIFLTNALYGPCRVEFYKQMNTYIVAYLILQIPVSLFQVAMWGMGDWVGGSAGFGHSGNMSFLIYLCTFFLLMQKFDSKKLIRSLINSRYVFLLWIPTFVNETKISFVLIILFLLFCLNYTPRSLVKNILILACGMMILGSFLFVYQKLKGASVYNMMTGGYYATEYSFLKSKKTETVDPDVYADLPRTIRFYVAGKLLTTNTNSLLFGKSLGHFKGSDGARTAFANQYEYLVVGSKPFVVIVAIQVGLIGLGLTYLALFIGLSRKSQIIPRLNTNKNRMRTFLLTCVIIIGYYSGAFRDYNFTIVFAYLGIWATLPRSIYEELSAQQFTNVRIKPIVIPGIR